MKMKESLECTDSIGTGNEQAREERLKRWGCHLKLAAVKWETIKKQRTGSGRETQTIAQKDTLPSLHQKEGGSTEKDKIKAGTDESLGIWMACFRRNSFRKHVYFDRKRRLELDSLTPREIDDFAQIHAREKFTYALA